eukprot:SAG31_NODE_455_length_15433_cov_4.248728_8_plen_62_part_00
MSNVVHHRTCTEGVRRRCTCEYLRVHRMTNDKCLLAKIASPFQSEDPSASHVLLNAAAADL